MTDKFFFVEDSTDLGDLTKQYLETKGFAVDWFTDSTAGLRVFKKDATAYSLCLLDIQIPLQSGFEMAEEILKFNSLVPFVFLTARAEKKDKLLGLDIGAADYITKPFDIDELVLRLRNILSAPNNTNLMIRTAVFLLLAILCLTRTFLPLRSQTKKPFPSPSVNPNFWSFL